MSAIAINRSPLPNPQTIKGGISRVQFKFLMARIRVSNSAHENSRPNARLQNSFVGITGGEQRGQQLGNMSWSPRLHGDVDRRIA